MTTRTVLSSPNKVARCAPLIRAVAVVALVTASTALGSTTGQSVARADPQTVMLDVANWRWHNSVKEFESDCYPPSNIHEAASRSVGWGQFEDMNCWAIVSQRAVLFNTAPLDNIPEKTIDRAVLTYDESRGCWGGPYDPVPAGPATVSDCWQSGGGAPEFKPDGCVVVRATAQEWLNKGIKGPLPYITTSRPTITRIGTREWDVTEPFRWQLDPRNIGLQPPGAPPVTPGYGFLLTGGITSLDQLTGDDETFCMSGVENVQLHVTYTVPPPGGEFRPPR